jgi:hypothetical protein
MKKDIRFFISILSVLFAAIFLSSCVKDNITRTYTYSYYVPVYKTTAEVRAGIRSDAPQDVVNPRKIVMLGNYIFLNEIDKGIHIIDNSNPASPHNVAFIHIPGNMDLALKGNTLYADLYTDLVTLDISNPLNVQVKKYSEGVFPYRSYGNGFVNDTSAKVVIVDWQKRDTTVKEGIVRPWDGNVYYDASGLQFNSSSGSSSKSSSSPVGKGGSMARFTIVKNRLYTVSYTDLNIFNIATTDNPVYVKKVNVGTWNVETIFPFQNQLLIGSQNGMFVYNIHNPDDPALTGSFSHVQSCDPVIADGNFAYVTLRTGTSCFGNTNALEILTLNGFPDLQLIKTYTLTNPHGLSKDGKLLFICDGTDGLKIYNASDVTDLKLVKHIPDIETYDVIANDGVALVVAKDGLYQYYYADIHNIRQLSKIGISN